MKKTIVVIVAVLAPFGAFALDGTFIASNQFPDPVTGEIIKAIVYDMNGTTRMAKDRGAVQFVIDGAVVGITASNPTGVYGFFLNGVFSAGVISVPDKAGQTVDITVQVWDKTTAATYAEALVFGYYLSPQTVSVRLGGWLDPQHGNFPYPAAGLVGLHGFSLIMVPEPSTYALAALGLGGLLFISRRKQPK